MWSCGLLCLIYSCLVDAQPDTQEVDRSEIHTQILLATASSGLKSRHSFTHMLAEASCVYIYAYLISKTFLSVDKTENWNPVTDFGRFQMRNQ